MRDIVYKKTEQTEKKTRTHTKPLPEMGMSPSFIDQIIHAGNISLGFISEKLNSSEKQLVITPNTEIPRASRTKVKKIRKPLLVKKHLKTPHAKLALANALILAGALTYVTHVVKTNSVAKVAQGSAIVASTDVRQYLPQTRSLEKVEPFKEDALSPASTKSIPIYTWVTPWNVESLSETNQLSSSLSAFWLTVSPGALTFTPKADWSRWTTVRSSIGTGKTVYLTVTGDPDDTVLALTNPDTQKSHIAELLRIVQEQGFDGIDIDYEALGSSNKEFFTTFVRALSTTFHENNKKVAVTLESRLGNQVPMDWKSIGILVDEARIMIYDYHGKNTGFPGPIAPLGWVKDVVTFATTQIPSNKLVIGLGNYGYDWVQNGDSWQGTGQSFEQATAKAKEMNTPIINGGGIDERGYDIGLAPTFTYRDSDNAQHVVWFEDQQSLQAKVDLVKQYPIRGIIFWSVGLGDSQFWAQHSNKGGI